MNKPLMNKIACLLLFYLIQPSASGQDKVVHLLCEGRPDPVGVDVRSPGFSWQTGAARRSWKQAAYQIMVADDSLDLKNNVATGWNSGQVASDQSLQLSYGGKKLLPAHRYFWKVRVWNTRGGVSDWSAVASFTTGLYELQDWSGARWIGYALLADSSLIIPGVHSPDVKKKLGPDKAKERTVVPLFRKTFTVDKQVKRALAFISGMGQYEMYINGRKTGASFLAPGWTAYDKRRLYNAYDISANLAAGDNAIGVIVGNGFFNISRERYFKAVMAYGWPQMICKILITYTDGTIQIIISDKSWKTAPSPVTFTSIYGGEDYDARLEQKGWSSPAFDALSWKGAQLIKTPKSILQAETDYPVQVREILPVKSVAVPVPGIYLYDFGQNASGIIELKLKGHKGQTVRFTPAELLTDKGLANQNATGKPYYFSYTLRSDSVETWSPRFSYYGFRYVQVEGALPDSTGAPADSVKLVSLAFLHTGNSTPEGGGFSCSNQLFNNINTLIKWAIKSNLQSVATDCPHREKLSWLEQDYLMGPSIKTTFNVYLLYKKLVTDMIDAQTPEGLVPDIAPEYVFFDDNGFGFRDSPEWGSAAVIVPWQLYKWYGDTSVLRRAYPMMKKYAAYLEKKAKGGILSYGLGDWYDYGPNHPGVAQLTPPGLTATAVFYQDLKTLSAAAALLGVTSDAVIFDKRAERVKIAFTAKYFNARDKIYATGSQTAMAMPLCVGLVDRADGPRVLRNLVDSIYANNKALTAGDIGYHYLVEALTKGGASGLIYDMNNRDDVAGYGFQLKRGATALTESWQALPGVSNNHLMLGHIMEWFYIGLAGIDQEEASVGYKAIVINPQVIGDITWVSGSYDCPYGKIRSEWKKEGGRFTLHVQIPANTTATIYLPAKNLSGIKIDGKILKISTDIISSAYKEGKAVLKTGSGDYNFTSEF